MSRIGNKIEQIEVRLLESTPGQKFLAWYRAQPDRDQRLFKLLAISLVALLLLLVLIFPPARYAANAVFGYQAAAADYQWMVSQQSNARAIASLAVKQKTSDELASLITAEAGALGFEVSRYSTTAKDGLQVTIDSASFAAILAWLDTLSSKHKVRVLRAQLSSGQAAGLVRVQLELQG